MTPIQRAKRILTALAEAPAEDRENVLAEQLILILKDEDCRLAQIIDDAYLKYRIQFPSQAAMLCRQEAYSHRV